ncbi:MAG: hypothetical protein HY231_27360 [Acidobacteria bacterium]|nr:hypothetical protein [Acidobacteriota bacterium]
MIEATEAPAHDQCRHLGCTCKPLLGENYCSAHCEVTPYETHCGCGHAECEAKAVDSASQTA